MSVPNPLNQTSLLRSWCVVLSSALFFFYIFIQMNLFNSINVELVKEFKLNARQISQMYAFFAYGNVLFLFPAGILLDRFSVRKLLFAVFTISIIATYLFSTASCFWTMNIARLAIGVAGAFALLSSVKLATRWFDPKHMALVIGVVVTMAMVGGAIAQTPLTILTQKFGWRIAMQLVVSLGIVLMITQSFIVRDEPKGLEKLDIAEHEQLKQIGFWSSLRLVATNKQNWLSGVYISLVNLPLFILGGIWGAPFLTQVHKFTQVQATAITGMLFIGMMIGSPLAGLISDRMGLRKLPMTIGALFSIAVVSAIIFSPTLSFVTEASLFFALGLIISAQVIGYPVIAESNAHSITATATGLGSVLIMSGGMLAPLFGWLLDFGETSSVTYSAGDFMRANSMLLVGLVIALIASLLIRETYCKQNFIYKSDPDSL